MTAGAGPGPAVGPPGREAARQARGPHLARASAAATSMRPWCAESCSPGLASLVSGHAGVRPTVAERVAAALDGPMPRVPLDGQAGPVRSSRWPRPRRGCGAMTSARAKMEALLGGAPCSAALVADAAIRARHRLRHAEGICALSIEAFRAPLGAYDEALDGLWGDPHETAALRGLRRYLEGAGTAERRFHQAPVSYRIIPRVLGQRAPRGGGGREGGNGLAALGDQRCRLRRRRGWAARPGGR